MSASPMKRSFALIIEAVVVVLVVRFFPTGIVGLITKVVTRLRVRSGKPPASLATEYVKTMPGSRKA